MNFESVEKIKWQIVSRKGVNFENLWLSIAAYGFLECLNKKPRIFGPTYASAYRQIDGHRSLPSGDIARFLKQAKHNEARKSGSILKTYYEYEKILKATKVYSEKIDRINFKKFSNRKLADFFRQYARVTGKTIWYGYNYYLYQYLGQDFYRILQSKEKNFERQSKLFDILTQAKKMSVMQQEQYDLLLVAKQIKGSKLSMSGRRALNLIDWHLRKYSYMGFFYFRGGFWRRENIIQRLKEKFKSDYYSEIKKIDDFKKANKKWRQTARHLGFSRRETILAETLKQMAYCTNLYDEVSNYLCAKSQNLLMEIGRRLKISYQELIEMDIMEIRQGLISGLGNDDKKILSERLKDSALLFDGRQNIIISGADLKKYRRLFLKPDASLSFDNELKGQAASAGLAKGRAVLVFSVNDLPKVKRGNIMVAIATVPSFVPAMEKTAGIITEAGGLLSHSAIVSRELKIPCIVGVKNATLIIKDGDRVEVDATNGMVRKI